MAAVLPEPMGPHLNVGSVEGREGDRRARVCVNCGVYEPLRDATDICCRAVNGVSCVFLDYDVNKHDEIDDAKPAVHALLGDSGSAEVEGATDSTMPASRDDAVNDDDVNCSGSPQMK